jgi:hypothetical protein
MNGRVLAFVLLTATMLVPNVALAETCSPWKWQKDDNLYHQDCVNSEGISTCFRATDANGSNREETACS